MPTETNNQSPSKPQGVSAWIHSVSAGTSGTQKILLGIAAVIAYFAVKLFFTSVAWWFWPVPVVAVIAWFVLSKRRAKN
jgi:hypothetical protein